VRALLRVTHRRSGWRTHESRWYGCSGDKLLLRREDGVHITLWSHYHCSRLLPVSTFLQVRWGVLVELGAYSGPWPVCRDITRLANHISHSHRLLGRYSTLPSWGFSLPPEKTCIRRAQWLTAPVEPIC
jgi:hypothetical protein